MNLLRRRSPRAFTRPCNSPVLGLRAGQGQGDVPGDALSDRGLRRARRARVRDPGPEENHLPVLQAASQGEKRERAGEMSHGLSMPRSAKVCGKLPSMHSAVCLP
jgi:hypothetical protein